MLLILRLFCLLLKSYFYDNDSLCVYVKMHTFISWVAWLFFRVDKSGFCQLSENSNQLKEKRNLITYNKTR